MMNRQENGSNKNKRLSSSRSQSSLRTVLTPVKRLHLTKPSNTPSKSSGQESNINVYVRCRSRNEREILENSGVVVSTLGKQGKEVILKPNQHSALSKTYTFDNVFGAESDQEVLFEEVAKNALTEMLQGYNCTIFAYGQTGTGKTYTMSGDISTSDTGVLGIHAGIIPRTLVLLFNNLQNSEGEHSVRVSFIELYNEELKDLLAPDDAERKVRIYDDQDKKSIVVQGMEEVFIQSAKEGLTLLGDGSYKRQVAATQCNDLSSRSHTVFTITVHMTKIDPISGEEYLKVGKLNLVDLAGSENINRSGAENKRARELGMINQSLLTLGRVINCLVDKSSHIPYRESKLTRLLQDSLGGQTKTCIIATISPAKVSLEETMSTLEYASRAKNIKNKPQVNQSVNKQLLMTEYVEEIERLRKILILTREQNGGVYLTTESHQKLLDENESAKILIDEQKLRIDLLEDQNKKSKENYEMQLEESRNAKEVLLNLQSKLDKTKFQLIDMELKAIEFENKYNDELAEKEDLQRTHQQSQAVYKSLVGVVKDISEAKVGLENLMHQATNSFDASIDSLESKKSHINDFIEVNLQESLSLLKERNETMLQQLNSEFNKVVTSEQNKLQERILDIERSRSGIFDNVTTSQNAISVSKADMDEAIKETFEAFTNYQDSFIAQMMPSLQNFINEALGSHLNMISDLESTIQNCYHTIGQKFKTTFELIDTQITGQLEELTRLSTEFDTHTRRNNKILKDQIMANELLHKQELELQDQEQKEILHRFAEILSNSTKNRIARISKTFGHSQECLNTINSDNVEFSKSHRELFSNLVESETIFSKAVKQEKEELKAAVVSSHENSKNSIKKIEQDIDEFSALNDIRLAEIVDSMKSHQHISQEQKKKLSALSDRQAGELKSLNDNLSDKTKQVFANISNDLTTFKEAMLDIKPTIVDKYVSEQRSASEIYEKSVSKNNETLKDSISSLNISKPDIDIPKSKDYQFPSQLPTPKPRDELLQFKKRKVCVARDDTDESFVLNEFENMTPLPAPAHVLPMIENTPSSMLKVKPLKNINRSRPTTGGNSSKNKVLQELNL